MNPQKTSRTLSSNGKQISRAEGNQVIEFYDTASSDKINVSAFVIETFATGCFIILNDDVDVLHEIDSQSEIGFDGLNIYKVTIVQPNVQYRWTAIM